MKKFGAVSSVASGVIAYITFGLARLLDGVKTSQIGTNHAAGSLNDSIGKWFGKVALFWLAFLLYFGAAGLALVGAVLALVQIFGKDRSVGTVIWSLLGLVICGLAGYWSVTNLIEMLR